MKVIQINAVCGQGSTGKICLAISQQLTAHNIENYIFYASGYSDYPLGIKYTNDRYLKLQALKARIFGNWGFNSRRATRKLIAEMERIQPNIVYLHNLHGHNCHLSMLFKYFQTKGIKVFWTFHDCWAFTGYCMHFTMAKCDKWKFGCGNCPLKRQSSWFFDRSKQMWGRKKQLVNGIDLTIITPSNWLADLVRQSFYNNFPIQVIHNGIDLQVFHPIESNFRKKYNLGDKYIVLGVADLWLPRKGPDIFVELSKRLDSSKYQIVLVGSINEKEDKIFSSNILFIGKTKTQRELAEIYTVADIFVNPTREEVLGLVNLESLACGTPVITFCTGGSPECIDQTCGHIVQCEDVDSLEYEIINICSQKPYDKKACINHAKYFMQEKKFQEYINLLN